MHSKINSSSDLLNSEIKDKKDKQQELRNEWVEVNKRTFSFDENQSICPCCGRPYDMGKIEEIKQNAEETFAISKKKSLDLIADEGKKLGDKIAELRNKYAKNTSEITKYKCKIAEIEKRN